MTTTTSTAAAAGNNSNPWAWLGLLKWSLSYADGTVPSDQSMTPMSDEDKVFLESVMKEGIIDENERMKTILTLVTDRMAQWKEQQQEEQSAGGGTRQREAEDEVEELLQELRDIVEQVDYARAFAAVKGLEFLLGCVQQDDMLVPSSTREACLGILATMSQNNPPVQAKLLELGALEVLSRVFFREQEKQATAAATATATGNENDDNGKLRAKIMQAMGAMVRGNDLAEGVFCRVDQAVALLEMGLGVVNAATTTNTSNLAPPPPPPPPAALRKRTLFFLRALVTSDTATRERIEQFSSCIAWAIRQHVLQKAEEDEGNIVPTTTTTDDEELYEMTLDLIAQILEQAKSVNVILDRKDALARAGVRRIAALRELITRDDLGEDDDGEYVAAAAAREELERWENVLALLARAGRDGGAEEQRAQAASQPLLLTGSTRETLAQ